MSSPSTAAPGGRKRLRSETPSACSRVLQQRELLENILFQLPVSDLLNR